jgi:hypothetical protein
MQAPEGENPRCGGCERVVHQFPEIREAGFRSDVLLVSLLNEKSACPAIAGFFLPF